MTTLEALALAEDGIRIALKTAGFENVDNMSQFERASALLDMAQELAALNTPTVWANRRGYNSFPTKYDMFERNEEICSEEIPRI